MIKAAAHHRTQAWQAAQTTVCDGHQTKWPSGQPTMETGYWEMNCTNSS